MTDRSPEIIDLPEGLSESGHVIIPEVVDEIAEPVMTSEDAALIDETIIFINRTVSGKSLETALLIGNYLLMNFFNNDIDAAFSKDSQPAKNRFFGYESYGKCSINGSITI